MCETADTSPASYAQEALWLWEQLGGDPAVGVLPMAWRVVGAFDAHRFARALRLVADRNPVLLSGFEWDDRCGRLVTGRRHHSAEIPVDHVVTGRRPAPEAWHAVALRPFTAGEPLVRASSWTCGEETLLVVVVAALVLDEGAEAALFAELAAAYRHLGDGTPLGPPPAPFAQFAARQRARFDGPGGRGRVDRAVKELPLPRAVKLPPPHVVRDQPESTTTVHRLDIGAGLSDRVRRVAEAHATSERVVVLSAFAAVAARLAGQDTCSLLVPHPDRAGTTIGPCRNDLFLTVDAHPLADFGEIVDAVHTACQGLDEAHDVPAGVLRVRWAEYGVRPTTNLVFDVTPGRRPELVLPACATTRVPVPERMSADVRLSGRVDEDGLSLELHCRTAAVSEEDGRALAAAVTELLDAACTRPGEPLAVLPTEPVVPTPPELTSPPLPEASTLAVVDQVSAAARCRPDATAITSPAGELTYGELAAHIGQRTAGTQVPGPVAAALASMSSSTSAEHAELARYSAWQREVPALGPGDRIAWSGPGRAPGELFAALVRGATLVVPEPADLAGPGELLRWLDRTGVNVLHLTPGLADALVAAHHDDPRSAPAPRALRATLCSGGGLHGETARAWRRLTPSSRLFTLYRPPGAGVVCCGEVPENPAPTIQPVGRPLPGMDVRIDVEGRWAGTGEVGEIVVHPAVGRPHRTGDLGRRRPDGTIDVLGRAGEQVTIRGVRVHPAEVAAVLRADARIAWATAVVRPEGLVGYAVARGGAALPTAAVLGRAGRLLPAAFVPSALVQLHRLPLRPDGELDPRQLPGPPEAFADAEPAEPRDEVEAAVLAVFQSVLATRWVGVHDDFVSLGGHSLHAVGIAVRLRGRLGVAVPPRLVLDHATPASLAGWIAAHRPARSAR